MTHYQITIDDSLLPALFSGGSGLKPLLEQILNQILLAQSTEAVGAAPHERTEERQGYRNGYRERTLQTRIGTLTLSVPRLRDGSFSPELWERWQRSEQAFVLALLEMVIQGVSTRKVEAVCEELCGAHFSKSTVSALCERLDPLVNHWRNRPLTEVSYPFLLVDALVIRVREDKQVRPVSLLLACGVREDGHREILGFALGDSESEANWSEFFASLKQRGLSGVFLVTSDDHAGLVKAVGQQFQGVVWQRCQVHFVRNVLSACPAKEQKALLVKLRHILEASDEATARQQLRETVKAFESSAPRAMECLENGFEDVVAVLCLPERYRKRLRSTNSVERLNEEIRRRERVIRIFPNRRSAERLMGALLMEFDEAWTTGKIYLDMSEFNNGRNDARKEQQGSQEAK
jgi:transposase-like protein